MNQEELQDRILMLNHLEQQGETDHETVDKKTPQTQVRESVVFWFLMNRFAHARDGKLRAKSTGKCATFTV